MMSILRWEAPQDSRGMEGIRGRRRRPTTVSAARKTSAHPAWANVRAFRGKNNYNFLLKRQT